MFALFNLLAISVGPIPSALHLNIFFTIGAVSEIAP